jgi:hypothetical protein
MKRLVFAAAAAGIVVALAGCGGGGGPSSRADYVKANTNLFNSLPAYPNAKVVSSGTSSYAGSNNSVGYQTKFNVTVPATATAIKLQSFYAGHLQSDWKLVAQLDGPVLNFRKGNAFISINMTSSSRHKVAVTVDNDFYGHTG